MGTMRNERCVIKNRLTTVSLKGGGNLNLVCDTPTIHIDTSENQHLMEVWQINFRWHDQNFTWGNFLLIEETLESGSKPLGA